MRVFINDTLVPDLVFEGLPSPLSVAATPYNDDVTLTIKCVSPGDWPTAVVTAAEAEVAAAARPPRRPPLPPPLRRRLAASALVDNPADGWRGWKAKLNRSNTSGSGLVQMGSAGSPMSNHEIETRLPPPEGGGGLHDQGTLLHSVCMRHESGLRIAIRRTKIVVHRPGEDKYWQCWIVQRAGLFGASDPPPLCKWEEMPVHILSVEQQTTPEARLFPPNAPFDRAGFTIEENQMFDDLASGRMFGSGSPIFNPCDWTTRGGPWGFGAWSFYWCDAAGDVCDGTSAHEINSDTPSAGPGGRGRIGEQELYASALRAATSIGFRYRRWSRRRDQPTAGARRLDAVRAARDDPPAARRPRGYDLRPPPHAERRYLHQRRPPTRVMVASSDATAAPAAAGAPPAPAPNRSPGLPSALLPPRRAHLRTRLRSGRRRRTRSCTWSGSACGWSTRPSSSAARTSARVMFASSSPSTPHLRPRSRCGTRGPTCARTAPRRSLKSIRRRKRRRRRRGWIPR